VTLEREPCYRRDKVKRILTGVATLVLLSVIAWADHPDVETYRKERVGDLGLLVSRDGGQTWRPVALKGQADFHALTYSPEGGGVLYGWSVVKPAGLVRIALDTMRAERLRAAGLADVLSLSASPDSRPAILAGTRSGLKTSLDGGRTWSAVRTMRSDGPVVAVTHHVDEPRLVFAYVQAAGAGLVRSDDGGTSWQSVALDLRPGEAIVALAAGPGDRVAAATSTGEVWQSRDRGRSWQPVLQRRRR
jgi:photosystem II stability/assembly factor-like uncharacterized protein